MSPFNVNSPRRINTPQRVRVNYQTPQTAVTPTASAEGTVQLLEIDGSQEKERYIIRINGQPLRLTAKSFKYLAKLAWRRANNPTASGWVYKEDIEVGYNQARYLYRMKNEITADLNLDWPVVENNRLGYYRLNTDPEKIRINLVNLQNHPDFELREMVSSAEIVN